MAFLGQDPAIREIVVDNKCLQQLKNFKYLCCEISCENEKDNQQKPAIFAQILGILGNIFKPPLVQKFSRKKYIIHRLSQFLYMKAKHLKKKGLKPTDITRDDFFSETAGYTLLNHKRNEETLEELTAEPTDEKLRRYKSNWLHVTRRNNNRMPNQC